MTAFDDDRDTRMDLLVDGELDDASRRDFLRNLDASPDGWRACALAFLEAQALRSAIAPVARVESRAVPIVATPRARSRPVAWLARAAIVLATFGLGWMSHVAGGRVPSSRDGGTVAPAPSPPIASRPPVPSVAPKAVVATSPPRKAAAIGYVQGKLEREGYRLEQRLILVPASTKDGRRVAVPVRQTAVRFVGNRAV